MKNTESSNQDYEHLNELMKSSASYAAGEPFLDSRYIELKKYFQLKYDIYELLPKWIKENETPHAIYPFFNSSRMFERESIFDENNLTEAKEKKAYVENYFEEVMNYVLNNLREKQTNMLNTKKWLAIRLNCPVEDVKELYENEMALDFLLVWTQFETTCFEGFFSLSNKTKFIKSFFQLNQLNQLLVNSHEEFYNRYNNMSNLNGLFSSPKGDPVFQNILNKNITIQTEEEKLYLILTVIGRYRHNLFHGNKELKNWLHYEETINKCTKCMKELVDLTLNLIN